MNLLCYGIPYQANSLNFGKKITNVKNVVVTKVSPDGIKNEVDRFLKTPNIKNLRTLNKMYRKMLNDLTQQQQACMNKFPNGDVIFDNSKCYTINEEYTNLKFMSALNNAITRIENAIKSLCKS